MDALKLIPQVFFDMIGRVGETNAWLQYDWLRLEKPDAGNLVARSNFYEAAEGCDWWKSSFLTRRQKERRDPVPTDLALVRQKEAVPPKDPASAGSTPLPSKVG
jgi:hypothetical protein